MSALGSDVEDLTLPPCHTTSPGGSPPAGHRTPASQAQPLSPYQGLSPGSTGWESLCLLPVGYCVEGILFFFFGDLNIVCREIFLKVKGSRILLGAKEKKHLESDNVSSLKEEWEGGSLAWVRFPEQVIGEDSQLVSLPPPATCPLHIQIWATSTPQSNPRAIVKEDTATRETAGSKR